ncbi:unnamed protein product, partial [Closterium sp. NIES-53]
YDDTNPEAEKQEYIDHIEEIVSWLGWKPFKITYSSDYFQELYDLAVQLIKSGHAYVDHQTAEEIKQYREKHLESPWRNRPVEESLKLFDDMRRGLVEEGAATLRMKQDMRNENPNMWDLIAYRIKFTPHPHVGDKWCIYPSYDYTHCIIDSLENITHSLCTLEFETRRASYYWLLEALGLYHPYVWEYARLNITHTMLSKRKLNRLVTDHHVNGWDDPRLMTLSGLRRRGAHPAAINAFCRAVGITRNENVIRVELLEHFMRDHLNRTAPRSLVVLKPLKVVITNVGEEEVEMVEGKRWPDAKEGDPEATYKLPFSRVVYIEQSDFRVKDSKDYYGLAPNKSVMLRYAYPIKCTEVIYEEDGTTVKELRAECDRAKSTKPKGVIHWVAEPKPGQAPLTVTIRLINKLFLSENPNELEDWLGDLNPESMEEIEGALAEPSLAGKPAGSPFQFERLVSKFVSFYKISFILRFHRYQALVDQWIDFTTNEIDAHLWRWFAPYYGYGTQNQEVLSTFRLPFALSYFTPFYGYGTKIQEVEDKAKEACKRGLASLNSHLESNTYLVGNRVTLADIVAVSQLWTGYITMFTLEFMKEFPHVDRYWNTLINQPKVKKVIGEVQQAQAQPTGVTTWFEGPIGKLQAAAAPKAAPAAAAKVECLIEMEWGGEGWSG